MKTPPGSRRLQLGRPSDLQTYAERDRVIAARWTVATAVVLLLVVASMNLLLNMG